MSPTDAEWITPRIAALKILHTSERHVRRMCEAGVFPNAHKPGISKLGHWRILRIDVMQHKLKSYPNPKYV